MTIDDLISQWREAREQYDATMREESDAERLHRVATSARRTAEAAEANAWKALQRAARPRLPRRTRGRRYSKPAR